MITDAQFEELEQAYDNQIPAYIKVVSEGIIKIKAEVWEGAGNKWIKITPIDVINYYRQGNSMGCASMSGCRTLATFTTDWRMVDNMAKECLEVFKIINREALEKEGKKYGMEMK